MRNKVRCKCGRRIQLGGVDSSDKRHGHCRICKLEWHMTSDGKIYSHPHDKFKKTNRVFKKIPVVLPKLVPYNPGKEKPEFKPSFTFMEIARVKE